MVSFSSTFKHNGIPCNHVSGITHGITTEYGKSGMGKEHVGPLTMVKSIHLVGFEPRSEQSDDVVDEPTNGVFPIFRALFP